MHCTAWLTACPFCMRGREEALASLQLSMAAPRWPALQEGAPTGEQGAGRPGRLASWCLASRTLPQSRSTWRLRAPAMQGDVQARGRGCDARGRDDLGPAALVFRGKKVG